MNLTSLGRVVVATPGTPVALPVAPNTVAATLVLQAVGNTGKTYFGLAGLSKTTLAGVSRVLATTDSHTVNTENGTDGIQLSQLGIDADVAGEGLLISYWTE